MESKRFFIIRCSGELRTIADYTPEEIVNEFWNQGTVEYKELDEFGTLEEARKALRENALCYYRGYTNAEKGASPFIYYEFCQIQERTLDEDGEIIDTELYESTARGFILKFKVSYFRNDPAQARGSEPCSGISYSLDDYVTAQDAETAVDLARGYITEQAMTYGEYYAEEDENGRVNIYEYEGGALLEQFYNFYAEPIGG